MDTTLPAANAVGVRDGRITAAGDEDGASARLGPAFKRIDCEGGALLPAFIDAHCHLLAYAAALASIDCTGARSIADIQNLIRTRAGSTPAGAWLRAFGYEETSLAEGRHPNRHDLDAAAPEHPVRLMHRSGHASVLNTVALRIAGITIESEEPAGGAIERDLSSGEPNGVLLDMEERIDCAVPKQPYEALRDSVGDASARMLREGITCIVDATHTNGRERWTLFERLMDDGAIEQDVVVMEGIDHLGELPETGAEGRLRRGAVKIMLHELGDTLSPDEAELSRQALEAHRAGRQVAIHAVGERAVTAAVAAIEGALRAHPRADHRHRIEHCGVLPRGVEQRIAAAGIAVVSQPAFLRERGGRYLQLLPRDKLDRLYAFRTLAGAGAMLAAGSDAPVTLPEPLRSIAGATERTSAGGHVIAPHETVDLSTALGWWTSGAAHTSFLERERGTIAPGLQADLVLLDRDPTACPPSEVPSAQIRQVWTRGRPRIEGT
jgi:predicted amidohydrolase YtcJ